MQLLKFELYKIFRQKTIYITFILLMVISLGFGLNLKTKLEKEIYSDWEGPLTEEKLQLAADENNELMKKVDELEMGQPLTKSDNIKMGLYETIAFSQSIEQKTESKLQELKNENKYNTELEREMLGLINISYFSYHEAPMKIIGNVSFYYYIVTVVMLLIGLSSIYSSEYSSGIDNYILSSKRGRGQLLGSKIGASLIYTVVVVFAWEICNLTLNFMQFGNKGWEMPLQMTFEYYFSPYAFNMLEFHLTQLGIHLVGALGFALLIVFISSISRNVLLTFFISGSFLALPLFLYEIIQIEWVDNLLTFSFAHVMKVQFLFDHFKTVNFFGYPVLYPIVAVIWMVVLSFILTMFTFKIMKNKEVIS